MAAVRQRPRKKGVVLEHEIREHFGGSGARCITRNCGVLVGTIPAELNNREWGALASLACLTGGHYRAVGLPCRGVGAVRSPGARKSPHIGGPFGPGQRRRAA